MSASDKAVWGVENTANLMRSTQACVRCHVGTLGRDVDHNLIAGSHPVLKFEFAGYLARLSKHWNGRDERLANLDFELCAWAAGQLAAAEASLEQIATWSGAAPQNPAHAAWPKFSKYDCYPCHHDLRSAAAARLNRPAKLTGHRQTDVLLLSR